MLLKPLESPYLGIIFTWYSPPSAFFSPTLDNCYTDLLLATAGLFNLPEEKVEKMWTGIATYWEFFEVSTLLHNAS